VWTGGQGAVVIGPCTESSIVSRKILYVVSDGAFFLSHRMPIAVAAKEAGYDVAVAAPNDDAVPRYIEAGFKFFRVPFRRRKHSLLNEYKSVSSLYKAVKEFRPDLAHLITVKPLIYGGIVCRKLGVPAVSAVTGLGHLFCYHSLQTVLMRNAVLNALKVALNCPRNHVIFQNLDDVSIFKRNRLLRKASFSVIPGCGADLKRIRGTTLPAGKTVLILPARMIRSKGVEEFVAVAKIFRKRGIPAIFRLVGDPDFGNPAAIPVDRLLEWSKERNIEWRSYTPIIEEELYNSHVVVLPSYREGFPKTLIEASAAGRACAASDVPGNRDAVVDGVTGILFPVKDVDRMADALERLVNDRQCQVRMGANARLHAEKNFDVADVVAKHLRIYHQMVDGCLPENRGQEPLMEI